MRNSTARPFFKINGQPSYATLKGPEFCKAKLYCIVLYLYPPSTLAGMLPVFRVTIGRHQCSRIFNQDLSDGALPALTSLRDPTHPRPPNY